MNTTIFLRPNTSPCNNTLPQVETPVDPWIRQEAAQPPLYYWLASWLIRPFDTAGTQEAVWLNPQSRLGDAAALSNRNFVVHTAAEQWPWADYVWAAAPGPVVFDRAGAGNAAGDLQRWAPSSGRRGREIALLATALVGFLPQFLFLHASVSNDPLIIFFSSVTLWWLLRLWGEGVTTGRSAILGMLPRAGHPQQNRRFSAGRLCRHLPGRTQLAECDR